eukprot:10130658-Heterocapsa_arctica.AAC.1
MEVDIIIFKRYAQKVYSDFVKETDMSILTKSNNIINNSAEKFEAESELMERLRAQAARELLRGAALERRLCAAELRGATDDVWKDELVKAAVKSLKRMNGNLVEAITAEIELKKGEVTK